MGESKGADDGWVSIVSEVDWRTNFIMFDQITNAK